MSLRAWDEAVSSARTLAQVADSAKQVWYVHCLALSNLGANTDDAPGKDTPASENTLAGLRFILVDFETQAELIPFIFISFGCDIVFFLIFYI